MSGIYDRTPEMSQGKPFRCYNCDRLLLEEVLDAYRLRLKCQRCKTRITLEMLSPHGRIAPSEAPVSTANGSPVATPASVGLSK